MEEKVKKLSLVLLNSDGLKIVWSITKMSKMELKLVKSLSGMEKT